MIKVFLKGDKIVELPDGKRGEFVRTTKQVSVITEEVIETTLDIRDADSAYSGKIIASFKADEVLYYTVDKNEEE